MATSSSRKFVVIASLVVVLAAAAFFLFEGMEESSPLSLKRSGSGAEQQPETEPMSASDQPSDPNKLQSTEDPAQTAWARTAAGQAAAEQIAQGNMDLPLPETLLLRYPNAMMVDVTQAPYHADNTGQTDSTAAIRAVFAEAGRTGAHREKIIYFPAGTYLVSDRLTLDPEARGGWGGSEVTAANVYIVGEDRNATVIRLADHSPAFADPKKPVSLLSYLDGPASNTSFFNSLRNITIDVGLGNPGAIAVDFHTNNGGGLEYVTLISRDPVEPGHTGLRMIRRLGGIGLIHQFRVVGFRRGVHAGHGRIGYVFNETEFFRQGETAVYNEDKLLWFFDSRFVDSPMVLQNANYLNPDTGQRDTSNGSQVIFVDSRMETRDPQPVAIDNRVGGYLFVRNVAVSGYQNAVLEAGDSSVPPAAFAAEYVNAPVIEVDGENRGISLGLPTPELPEVPWYLPETVIEVRDLEDLPEQIEEPETTWIVMDGSASENAEHESTLLQAAIDSGAWTVAMVGGITIDRTIEIRGAVRRLFAIRPEFGGTIRIRQPIRHHRELPVFRIAKTESDTLIIEGVGPHDWPTKAGLLYLNQRNRPVIFKDVPAAHMRFYRNGEGVTAPAFFVNCWGGPPMPMPKFPEEGNWLYADGQNVYLWQANPEYLEGFHDKEPYIKVENADCVIRGFKFGENTGPFFSIRNGSAELLGGLVNSKVREKMSSSMIPFASEDARLAVVAVEVMRGWVHPQILELRDGDLIERIPASQAPRRIGSAPGGFVLPLLLDSAP